MNLLTPSKTPHCTGNHLDRRSSEHQYLCSKPLEVKYLRSRTNIQYPLYVSIATCFCWGFPTDVSPLCVISSCFVVVQPFDILWLFDIKIIVCEFIHIQKKRGIFRQNTTLNTSNHRQQTPLIVKKRRYCFQNKIALPWHFSLSLLGYLTADRQTDPFTAVL